MRVQEILTESDQQGLGDDPEAIREFAREHCQPWLNQYGPDVKLYRGSRRLSGHKAYHRAVRTDRFPMNTSDSTHTMFNEWIRMVGGVANRSNSAFVTPKLSVAKRYGTDTFRVLPMGSFHYTWNRDASDWFLHYGDGLQSHHHWELMDPQRVIDWVEQNRPQQWQRFLKGNSTARNNPLGYVARNLDEISGPWLSQELELDRFQPDLYDVERLRQVIVVDRDLEQAMNQAHEIMIHASRMLYLPKDFEL